VAGARQPRGRAAAAALAIALVGIARADAAPVTAADLRPSPEQATHDRGRAYRDGCLVDQRSSAARRCVYGTRGSGTTVVLFGDSEAMQFFPPLLSIAQSRGWRLITRLRAGCVPADIKFSFRCDSWRKRSLSLIRRRDRPDLVVTTGGVAYRAIRDGRRLSSRASKGWMRRGWVHTLQRLRGSGARVALIKDTPRSPRNVPACVIQHPGRLDSCAFTRRQPTNRDFDRRAARRVSGVSLLDPTDLVCPGRTCPAVSGDVLVYRDSVHFTATFAATLTPWLGERLPDPTGG
jgi:hypothetical protein